MNIHFFCRVIIGLTQFTNKAHIARATLEAVCFQTREVRVNTGTSTVCYVCVGGGEIGIYFPHLNFSCQHFGRSLHCSQNFAQINLFVLIL